MGNHLAIVTNIIMPHGALEGMPFADMIKKHHIYGPWSDTQTVYELKLVNPSFPILHWYLLIKKVDPSGSLPFISVEITTSDLRTLTPLIREFRSCGNASHVDTYDGSLLDICKFADEVVEEMGGYHFWSNNGQHFCNKLLRKLRKDEFPTTYESNETDTTFDHCSRIYPSVNEVIQASSPINLVIDVSQCEFARSFEFDARATWTPSEERETPRLKLSKPAHPPTIADILRLVNILTPIQNKWEDLGLKLSIDPNKLAEIGHSNGQLANNCLREMLREYLQHPYNEPCWEVLANHVLEYSRPIANAIIRYGERVGY